MQDLLRLYPGWPRLATGLEHRLRIETLLCPSRQIIDDALRMLKVESRLGELGVLRRTEGQASGRFKGA